MRVCEDCGADRSGAINPKTGDNLTCYCGGKVVRKPSVGSPLIVIVNEDNCIIGVDVNSGGYPWLPSHPSGWKFFATIEDAVTYRDTFKHDTPNATGDPRKWRVVYFRWEIDFIPPVFFGGSALTDFLKPQVAR